MPSRRIVGQATRLSSSLVGDSLAPTSVWAYFRIALLPPRHQAQVPSLDRKPTEFSGGPALHVSPGMSDTA